MGVHDGLHYLEDSFRDVEEMACVARRGSSSSFSSPRPGGLLHLGIAQEGEEAGIGALWDRPWPAPVKL